MHNKRGFPDFSENSSLLDIRSRLHLRLKLPAFAGIQRGEFYSLADITAADLGDAD